MTDDKNMFDKTKDTVKEDMDKAGNKINDMKNDLGNMGQKGGRSDYDADADTDNPDYTDVDDTE